MSFRLFDAREGGPAARLWLAAALTLACGCSDRPKGEVVESADTPTWEAVEDTWSIEVLSEPQLQLVAGEQTTVRARITDKEAQPAVGLRVSFALVGQPQDSGLAALDATTNEDGVAENKLIAGRKQAAFALRISTPGADDIQIDVSVSGEGFGAVQVAAPYAGKREVARRIVSAQPGVKCDAPATVAPTREVAAGVDEVEIDGLPAGLTYAVTALAESAAQVVVARGCVDGVRVHAKETTVISIAFGDQALKPVGQFSVKAELQADDPAEALGDALRLAGERLVNSNSKGQVDTTNSEARFMLDSLEQTLGSSAYAMRTDLMPLRTALAEAREDPTPAAERSLQQALDAFSTGPLVAIPRVATVARTSLERLTLFASLTLDAEAKPLLTWQARRIQARPTVQGGNPPSLDLARLRLSTTTEARFVAEKDRIELSSVTFGAKLGALSAEVLPRALSAIAEGDASHPDPFGCMRFGAWLEDQEDLEGELCGSDCVRDTCDRAIERIAQAVQSALAALDDVRPDMRLRGTFELEDDDGDLLADSMEARPFSGEWLGEDADEGDSLTGNAAAVSESGQVP